MLTRQGNPRDTQSAPPENSTNFTARCEISAIFVATSACGAAENSVILWLSTVIMGYAEAGSQRVFTLQTSRSGCPSEPWECFRCTLRTRHCILPEPAPCSPADSHRVPLSAQVMMIIRGDATQGEGDDQHAVRGYRDRQRFTSRRRPVLQVRCH